MAKILWFQTPSAKLLYNKATAFLRRKSVRTVMLTLGLFLLSSAVLYVSTGKYRVYSNDILPSPLLFLEFDFFRSFYFLDLATITPAIVILVVLLILSCVTALAFRKKLAYGAVGLAVLMTALAIMPKYVIEARMRDAVVSCANHSGFWIFTMKFYLEKTLAKDPNATFPNTTDYLDVVKAWREAGADEGASLLCPGHRWSRVKAGYVFVGGGLPLTLVQDKGPLLMFCSYDCHPPPIDHQHAYADNQRQCMNDTSMMQLLEEALKKADTGEVPYSQEAVAIMRAELEARKARTPAK